MFWIEDTTVDAGDRRVLLATAGPYLLSVIEHDDGSAEWSCGVGEDDVINEHEGTAPDAEQAMRSAVEDARRRWLETDGMLGALEVDMRRAATARTDGEDHDLSSQTSSDRALGPKRATRLRRPEPAKRRRVS